MTLEAEELKLEALEQRLEFGWWCDALVYFGGKPCPVAN